MLVVFLSEFLYIKWPIWHQMVFSCFLLYRILWNLFSTVNLFLAVILYSPADCLKQVRLYLSQKFCTWSTRQTDRIYIPSSVN